MESKSVEVNIAEIKEKFIGTFPHSLGVEILSLEPGHSKIKMTVTQQMQNLHGMAHGGAIFTLADSALGLAANSRGKAVALQVSINYIRPAQMGAVLIATGEEEELTKSTGIYNIKVETAEGKQVALFRGTVFRP